MKLTKEPDSLFVKFFGEYPIIKVIDFLLENQTFDYSLRELAEHTGIGISTIYTFWGRLLEFGIVLESRKIDKATLYKLNTKSPLVKKIMEIDMQLSLGQKKGMAVKSQ